MTVLILIYAILSLAEFGDYNGCKHNECYLDDFYVMPNQVCQWNLNAQNKILI